MIFNSREEFVEKIGEEFLWNLVDDYIKHDVEQLKETLRQECGNIDLKDIDRLTSAEVQTSDEFTVTGYSTKDGVLTVQFETPSIIIASSDDESACFKVTTCFTGTAEIPDIDVYDWRALDFSHMHYPDILAYKHLARFTSVSYEYTEADDLNA